MLVDTGSPISILSEEIANKLNFETSEMRESDIKISGVDSSPIEVFGSVDCEIGLNSQKFAMKMTVAGIKSFSGILGMDFLEKYDVRLNIRRRTMTVLNREVQLEREITRTCARIVLAKNVKVPPESEMLVLGKIEGEMRDRVVLVEPMKYLKGKNVLLARSLVDMENDNVVLSVLNVGNKSAKMNKNDAIGLVCETDKVCAEQTDKSELGSSDLPEHLKPLLENVSESLNDARK